MAPQDQQIIEAQIPASQFYEQGFTEGDTLVLTPRKARCLWLKPCSIKRIA